MSVKAVVLIHPPCSQNMIHHFPVEARWVEEGSTYLDNENLHPGLDTHHLHKSAYLSILNHVI